MVLCIYYLDFMRMFTYDTEHILCVAKFVKRHTTRLVSYAHLPLDPRHEEIDDALLPLGGDGDPARHFPPLREAVAATAGAGVLGDKNGVSAHRRLPTIVCWIGGCETCSDEALAMGADGGYAFFIDEALLERRQMEATAKL